MFSRTVNACASDKGPPAKLTGLECYYHLSPPCGSADRFSETANLEANMGLKLQGGESRYP